jgi:hypothetical protein
LDIGTSPRSHTDTPTIVFQFRGWRSKSNSLMAIACLKFSTSMSFEMSAAFQPSFVGWATRG